MVTRSPTVKRRSSGAAAKPGVREQSAQATRISILRAATKVFAKYGYAGGSIEKISSAAKSYDRMIYYYFGSKEGLFIAVLEAMYKRMSDAELQLKLDAGQPIQAMTQIVAFVLGYYRKHPEFVTLLNTENLHKGQHKVEITSIYGRDEAMKVIHASHDDYKQKFPELEFMWPASMNS